MSQSVCWDGGEVTQANIHHSSVCGPLVSERCWSMSSLSSICDIIEDPLAPRNRCLPSFACCWCTPTSPTAVCAKPPQPPQRRLRCATGAAVGAGVDAVGSGSGSGSGVDTSGSGSGSGDVTVGGQEPLSQSQPGKEWVDPSLHLHWMYLGVPQH